jgi:hypothetical protein
MNMLSTVAKALSFVSVILLSGCGTMQVYEGPKRASHEVAVITSNLLAGLFDTAYILQIDGKDLGATDDNVEVLPGKHTVKIGVSTGLGYQQYIGNKTISFEAIAGHTYQVNGKIRKGDTFAWIEDKNTGELVAGEKP